MFGPGNPGEHLRVDDHSISRTQLVGPEPLNLTNLGQADDGIVPANGAGNDMVSDLRHRFPGQQLVGIPRHL